MAIGDTPNQNLFGTNYNPEDEEEKKARLAAQGAMMGAGNIPASAFGQAPAVAPFSMEAAGQVNPMMQPQSLEVTPQLPTELPVETTVDDSVRTGRYQQRQGELDRRKPTETTTEDNDPSFMSKVGSFLFPYGVGGVNRPTPELVQDGTTQAPSGVAVLGATPSVTLPVETLLAGAQGQGMDINQAAIMNALTDQDQGMDINQQAISNAQGQEATAPPPAQTLSQFMRYEDAPEQRTEQFVDAQGRLRFRPTQEALRLQAQGEVAQPPVDRDIIPAVTQPSVDGVVPPAVAQPPVDALSSFEQDSLSRQQRIGGTGSFEGDSEAREARVRANERRPGESQADRDTRVAQSKTTSGQTGGMSFDDARRRAEGQLAARGVKKPTSSQVNALARSIQAAEPERLAELETKRALDAIKLRDAEAKKDFKPQIVEIGDQKLIQLSPNYYQPVRPEPTAEEPFEPRVLEDGGFTYYEVAPNRFERQPSTKAGGAAGEVSSAIADAIAAGGEEVATPAPTVDTPEVATGDEFTPQQELGIQKVMADNEITREKAIEELRKAGKLK